MWSALDATHQQTLASSPNASDMLAAIAAAGIGIEQNSVLGFAVNVTAAAPNNVAAAQAIIDTESDWLPQTQARLKAQLAVIVADIIAAGRYVTVAGTQKLYQIDPASLAKVAGAGSLAMSCISPFTGTWSQGFEWIAADNSYQPMSATDCIAFAQNIGAYDTAITMNNRALKNAIEAATSASTLNALNLNSGWPSNP